MTTRDTIQASLEAIEYQKDTKLFQELVAKLAPFIAGETRFQTPEHFKLLGLEKIIEHHTGVVVEFQYTGFGNSTAAAIEPPVLDLNSPLLNGWRHLGYGEESIVPLLKTMTDLKMRQSELRASIDLKKGRVGGLFSKVSSKLYLGAGLWRMLRLNAEEVAAIILHEVGHAFTFFEAFLQTVPTNLALATAQRALSKLDKREERIQLIDAMADVMSLSNDVRNELKKDNTSERAFTVIAVKGYMDALRSGTGAWEYEMRNSEFAADQFATRQGAGRFLVSALDKLHDAYDPGYRSGRVTAWVIRIFELLCVILVTLATYGLYLILMFLIFFLADPVGSALYDPPSARFARIRQDLVQTLKRTDLDKSVRQGVVEQIEAIDKIRHGVQEHQDLFDWLWRKLNRSAARQQDMIQFHQELETIVNNDLYLHASKLKTLT